MSRVRRRRRDGASWEGFWDSTADGAPAAPSRGALGQGLVGSDRPPMRPEPPSGRLRFIVPAGPKLGGDMHCDESREHLAEPDEQLESGSSPTTAQGIPFGWLTVSQTSKHCTRRQIWSSGLSGGRTIGTHTCIGRPGGRTGTRRTGGARREHGFPASWPRLSALTSLSLQMAGTSTAAHPPPFPRPPPRCVHTATSNNVSTNS